jgi:hypothetical protein
LINLVCCCYCWQADELQTDSSDVKTLHKLGAGSALLMLLFFLPFVSQAQTIILKANPLGLPLATVNGAIEYQFAPKISLQIGGYYTHFRFKESNYSGWAVTPEIRYYFTSQEQRPEGWYAAPFVRYSQIFLEREETDDRHELNGKAQFLGGGIVVGHQWLLGEQKKVSINVFAGPKYSQFIGVTGNATQKDYKADFITGGGLWVRSGVTVGLAF